MKSAEIWKQIAFVVVLLFEMTVIRGVAPAVHGQRTFGDRFLSSSVQPQPATSITTTAPRVAAETLTSKSPNAITVATRIITLTEQWSEPSVICEQENGIEYRILSGEAASYEVRDADYPEAIYPFNTTSTIVTGNESVRRRIDKFQWRALGIRRAPVRLSYIIYKAK